MANLLKIISEPYLKNKALFVDCKCICGKITTKSLHDIRIDRAYSCGCQKRGKYQTKTNERLYYIWQGMKSRCKSKDKRHILYLKNKITVCNEWLDFSVFEKWALENGYKNNLSIERKNNLDNYCPENCCFITMLEQQGNKNNSCKFTFKGKTHHKSEWARLSGISLSTFDYRVKKWGIERAILEPLHIEKRR